VPESPQSLYTICRLYIKEDILCINQDPIPSRKCQNTPSKVVSVAPATCCSLLTFLELGSKNGSPCPLPSLPPRHLSPSARALLGALLWSHPSLLFSHGSSEDPFPWPWSPQTSSKPVCSRSGSPR
jgi:hypothetical protein